MDPQPASSTETAKTTPLAGEGGSSSWTERVRSVFTVGNVISTLLIVCLLAWIVVYSLRLVPFLTFLLVFSLLLVLIVAVWWWSSTREG